MNTHSYLRFATSPVRPLNNDNASPTKRSFVLYFRQAAQVKLLPLIYGLAAWMVGLFVTITPARAQAVTAQTYINNLYTWWKQQSAIKDVVKITVRATFLGGTAHPNETDDVSMSIFEGTIFGDRHDGYNAFTQTTYVPSAKGSGVFYKHDPLSATTLLGPFKVPFYLYYNLGGPSVWRLIAQLFIRTLKSYIFIWINLRRRVVGLMVSGLGLIAG